jgi:hypothetical protein
MLKSVPGQQLKHLQERPPGNGMVYCSVDNNAKDSSRVSVDSSSIKITDSSNFKHHQYQKDILSLLQDLNLTISNKFLPDLVEKLINIGYDSTLALGFVTLDDLNASGVENTSDCQIIQAAARQNMNLLAFRGPGVFSDSILVAHWLIMCGIPKLDALNYAEMLRQFGYTSVPHLELMTFDHCALSSFKRGHIGLLMYCIYNASTSNNSPVGDSLDWSLSPVQSCNSTLSIGVSLTSAAAADESSRYPEFDTAYDRFLDALLETNPQNSTSAMAGMSFISTTGPQIVFTSNTNGTTSRVHPVTYTISSLGARGMPLHGQVHTHHFSSMCERSQLQQPIKHLQEVINNDSTTELSHSNSLPVHIVKLLQEAINMPAPNPCRHGKKIHWSILANGGMQDPRFHELTHYTTSELQNGYKYEYHKQNKASKKTNPWTKEKIHQLEKATKDPRCRHLQKVCWELIATGRTGCPEYASLARFSASQLRSRYRSLFGDKRPELLRGEKKKVGGRRDKIGFNDR